MKLKKEFQETLAFAQELQSLFLSFKMAVTADVLIKLSWTVGESPSFPLQVYPKSFFIYQPWIAVWCGLNLYWTRAARSAGRRVMLRTWSSVMAVTVAITPTVSGRNLRYLPSSVAHIGTEVLTSRWWSSLWFVQAIPEGDWFCPECRPKQRSRRLSSRQRPSLESDEEMEESMEGDDEVDDEEGESEEEEYEVEQDEEDSEEEEELRWVQFAMWGSSSLWLSNPHTILGDITVRKITYLKLLVLFMYYT